MLVSDRSGESLSWSAVVGAIRRAGFRKEVGLLRPGPRGPRSFGAKWYGDVQGARSTRDGDTRNEDDSSFDMYSNCNYECHKIDAKWGVKIET